MSDPTHTPPLTPEARARLRALLRTATEGPWREAETEGDSTPWDWCIVGDDDVVADAEPRDAALIVAMHAGLPALLDAADERDKLAAEVERLVRERDAAVQEAALNDGYLKQHCEERDMALARERDLKRDNVALCERVRALEGAICQREGHTWTYSGGPEGPDLPAAMPCARCGVTIDTRTMLEVKP